ncbi:MAG: hypothetical protein IPN46_09410 [Saprospiraceae bacterium]|nr:hypothetical protein [Saprospiraceae bacterium]
MEKLYNKEELPDHVLKYGAIWAIDLVSRKHQAFIIKGRRQLTADQVATLIGMLKATTALDPTRNSNNSKEKKRSGIESNAKKKDFRFDDPEMETISRMINNGAINEKEYEKYIAKPVGASIR